MSLAPTAHALALMAVALLAAHLLAAAARRVGQPAVVGEIAAGLLLGPFLMALLGPERAAAVFPPGVLAALDVCAQLGLIGFMFLLGQHLRAHRSEVRPRDWLPVAVGSFTLPFAAGAGAALLFGATLTGHAGIGVASVLFFGLAVAITAVPVLFRILTDTGMHDTRLGRTAMSAAVATDGLAWMVLLGILVLAGTSSPGDLRGRAAALAVFVAVLALAVRPVFGRLGRLVDAGRLTSLMMLAALVVGSVGVAVLADVIGLHFAFGAVAFGIAVPAGSVSVQAACRTMNEFTVSVLLPIFFVSVALKISFGTATGAGTAAVAIVAIVLIAMGSKFAGVLLAWRVRRGSWSTGVRLGVLMNCRGLTELIVADVGLRAGLIDRTGFAVLVVTALVTTAATVPLLRLADRRAGRPDGADRPAVERAPA
ncbi:cation:proton antiporter [Paractinoplanes hotanensis]|uniref:Cation:proton antiporter n=1 Tax=Paractinoplanes hotanensis TaxID=2906497 RepID=A0ABT0YAR5_9ACTN|nr:cation:proton antiporter [Actinoplanes hotanensis]MCM4083127.1 cation:proton antiporter [Actinoplanes hotanensis]